MAAMNTNPIHTTRMKTWLSKDTPVVSRRIRHTSPPTAARLNTAPAHVLDAVFLVLELEERGEFLTQKYRSVGGANSITQLLRDLDRSLPLPGPLFLHLCIEEVGIQVPEGAITSIPCVTLADSQAYVRAQPLADQIPAMQSTQVLGRGICSHHWPCCPYRKGAGLQAFH